LIDPPKLVGPKSCAVTGAAIEVCRTDPLAGETGPRVVGRAVGVFERDTVESKRVLTVRETAEEGLALSESDSIGVEAERVRSLLNDLGESATGAMKF